MSKDSGNQLYSVWTYKPVHFVLQWDNGGNIDITNDADGTVSKVTVANLLEPSQIERKGFLTDQVSLRVSLLYLYLVYFQCN